MVLDRLPECFSELPDFTPDGVLPVGDYAPSRAQFEMRLVTSPRRASIFEGWNRHRQALLAAGLSRTSRQLLDGSFTESKAEPGDIDLVVAIETTSAGLNALEGSPVLQLLRGPAMKADYLCDAYPLYILPEDDPLYPAVTVKFVRYWTKWFGTTRSGIEKGRVWATAGGLS